MLKIVHFLSLNSCANHLKKLRHTLFFEDREKGLFGFVLLKSGLRLKDAKNNQVKKLFEREKRIIRIECQDQQSIEKLNIEPCSF